MLPGKQYTPAELLTLLWKSRWIISATFLAGIFAALVFSSQLQDKYRSEMLIQIVPQRVPDSYVQSTVTIRTEDRLDSISQQVMSRTQLERLIEEFDLYKEMRAKLPLEDVVDHMRLNINREMVRPTRNEPADAFYLRFTYTDAKIATAVTSRLGSRFIDQNARDRGQLAEATNDFLTVQLNEARSRLETQEQKLEAFRQRHSGRLPSQLEFNMQAIQSTQLQLQALVESLARDRDRKLLLERLHGEAAAEPLPVPPSVPTGAGGQVDPSAPQLTPQQQLDLARSTLEKLSVRLTPEHPDISRTKRLIEELERKVKAEAAKPPSPSAESSTTRAPQETQRRERLRQMRAELESLDRQIAFKESEERRLRDSVADYQARIAAVPALESEWVALTRDYDTLKKAYQDLLAKSEDSKVAADLERRQIGEQFRVLDPARVPVRAISPVRWKISVLGGGLGLLIGLALVALVELRDSSMHTEAQVIDVLNLPVVALIPTVFTPSEVRAQRRRLVLVSVAGTAVLAASGYVFWTMKLWKFVA